LAACCVSFAMLYSHTSILCAIVQVRNGQIIRRYLL
jgi:hypothetical protein